MVRKIRGLIFWKIVFRRKKVYEKSDKKIFSKLIYRKSNKKQFFGINFSNYRNKLKRKMIII
jgi:hypothetical protein